MRGQALRERTATFIAQLKWRDAESDDDDMMSA
eukprot:COSAG06_NODE_67482_length_251_cov_183.723684_1_plen_32_part_01